MFFFQTWAGKSTWCSTALYAFISFHLSNSETCANLCCIVSVHPRSNSGCDCCENQQIWQHHWSNTEVITFSNTIWLTLCSLVCKSHWWYRIDVSPPYWELRLPIRQSDALSSAIASSAFSPSSLDNTVSDSVSRFFFWTCILQTW